MYVLLKIRIFLKRFKIHRLIARGLPLQHKTIIKVSQELDELLNAFYAYSEKLPVSKEATLEDTIENHDCTDTQDVIDARNNMLANRVMGVVFSSTLQTFIDQGLSLCSEQACILDNLIYDCAMRDEKLTDLYHITCELQDILNEGIEI